MPALMLIGPATAVSESELAVPFVSVPSSEIVINPVVEVTVTGVVTKSASISDHWMNDAAAAVNAPAVSVAVVALVFWIVMSSGSRSSMPAFPCGARVSTLAAKAR